MALRMGCPSDRAGGQAQDEVTLVHLSGDVEDVAREGYIGSLSDRALGCDLLLLGASADGRCRGNLGQLLFQALFRVPQVMRLLHA